MFLTQAPLTASIIAPKRLSRTLKTKRRIERFQPPVPNLINVLVLPEGKLYIIISKKVFFVNPRKFKGQKLTQPLKRIK